LLGRGRTGCREDVFKEGKSAGPKGVDGKGVFIAEIDERIAGVRIEGEGVFGVADERRPEKLMLLGVAVGSSVANQEEFHVTRRELF
jgi:hypothetical protein